MAIVYRTLPFTMKLTSQSQSRAVALALLLLSLAVLSRAFFPNTIKNNNPPPLSTNLFATEQPRRRVVFSKLLAPLLTVGVLSTTNPSPAAATYSAYTHREQDWEQRQKSGEIQISNAKALRQQLKEIAPMNDSRSQVFCPNGPSSSVSPLMENKCNDRETMPSVFGRSDDVVGNSIPGFSSKVSSGRSSVINVDAVGGIPQYSK